MINLFIIVIKRGGVKLMNSKKVVTIVCSILAVAVIVAVVVFAVSSNKKDKKLTAGTDSSTTEVAENTENTEKPKDTEEITADPSVIAEIDASYVNYIRRPTLLAGAKGTYAITANVPEYTIEPDLSNVYNNELLSYSISQNDDIRQQLVDNGFYVSEGYDMEFFELYENNRYDYTANFITVDSMMHTYHLYFAYLLRTTERNYLSHDLANLSTEMLSEAKSQYDTLKGTEWEDAAYLNLAFFAVGNKLLDPNADIPSEVSDIVDSEVALINAAEGINPSPLFQPYSEEPVEEDYSQYKPRGYYDGEEALERYFRAMMWYGRRNFAQANDTFNRSAILMTIALDNGALDDWEKIYTVTSFFAGASDDSGYYEYLPIIDAAYGDGITVDKLVGNTEGYNNFNALVKELDPPQINSVPVYASDSDDEVADKIIGYRFMGQRFSIDEAIFTQLVYRNVEENSQGGYRMLPDALDVPAALGSDTALNILSSQGATDYKNYSGNMDKLRLDIANAPEDTWDASLYSGWINTLRPVLEPKGEGYPMFMQNEEWNKKNLVTFLGSYTELKHDTVLYSKQMMAEMGGADIPVLDDRGYVEPEVEVYRRLSALVKSTSDGLESYGYLDADSKADLALLAELSDQLQTISEKELRDELPTDEEFELIRTFGGQIEHFWQETNKDKADNDYFTSQEFPAAVVVDVATDPNGSCLEVGTGRCNTIYVVVPVDGQLKIAVGATYSFYEFEQPISNRLTDTQWRIMLGIELDENGSYTKDESIKPPTWTESFTKYYNY